jgi:hypothetical protein
MPQSLRKQPTLSGATALHHEDSDAVRDYAELQQQKQDMLLELHSYIQKVAQKLHDVQQQSSSCSSLLVSTSNSSLLSLLPADRMNNMKEIEQEKIRTFVELTNWVCFICIVGLHTNTLFQLTLSFIIMITGQ